MSIAVRPLGITLQTIAAIPRHLADQTSPAGQCGEGVGKQGTITPHQPLPTLLLEETPTYSMVAGSILDHLRGFWDVPGGRREVVGNTVLLQGERR